VYLSKLNVYSKVQTSLTNIHYRYLYKAVSGQNWSDFKIHKNMLSNQTKQVTNYIMYVYYETITYIEKSVIRFNKINFLCVKIQLIN